MKKEESEGRSASRIVPVVLAAGDSRRMGYPKALLPIGEDVFLTRILKTAAAVGLARQVIVLGRSADAIMPVIQGFPAGVCINRTRTADSCPRYSSGCPASAIRLTPR